MGNLPWNYNHTHGPLQFLRDSKVLDTKAIAMLNVVLANTIQTAVKGFTRKRVYRSLSEPQRQEALRLLANNISKGLAQFVDENSLKFYDAYHKER